MTVEPTVACFFASNQEPLFDDAADAWWRRLLLVRCDRRPDEAAVNPGLIDELKAEAPGILNWMLAAVPNCCSGSASKSRRRCARTWPD